MGQMNIDMNANGEETLISVSGHIDEDADFSKSPLTSNKLVFDLEKIEAINSCGIREWIKWMKTAASDSEIVYKNCPKIIIDQVNMVAGFLPSNGKIESFYVPYYSDDTGEEKMVLFKRGVEFDDSDVNPPEDIKDEDGGEMEMDIIEAKYFKFLKG